MSGSFEEPAWRWAPLALLLAASLVVSGASRADASKPASARQAAAIKAAAMRHCRKTFDDCRWVKGSARISTANPRYAKGLAVSSVTEGRFLMRPNRRSRKWRVVWTMGSGVPSCSDVQDSLPRSVIREFRLKGVDESGVEVVPCWR